MSLIPPHFQVKNAIVETNRAVVKYNKERNYRITQPQVRAPACATRPCLRHLCRALNAGVAPTLQMQALLAGEMGQVPQGADALFAELQDVSSRTKVSLPRTRHTTPRRAVPC